jgi:hypothetical protein
MFTFLNVKQTLLYVKIFFQKLIKSGFYQIREKYQMASQAAKRLLICLPLANQTYFKIDFP